MIVRCLTCLGLDVHLFCSVGGEGCQQSVKESTKVGGGVIAWQEHAVEPKIMKDMDSRTFKGKGGGVVGPVGQR